MKKWVIVFALSLLTIGGAAAQGCAVCSKTAADLGDKGAKGINTGIIYLAVFPLAILGALGFIWWRSNKAEEMSQ